MAATASDVLSMVLFARLVEARSFTAAAGKLGVSKSVVSARLSALEARLGTRLLHRTTRKLSLTPEGSRSTNTARASLPRPTPPRPRREARPGIRSASCA